MTSLASRRHSVRLHAALAVRGMVLLAFAAFFVVPLAWLVLAPTKTDFELLTRNPFAFGSLHNVWDAWQRVDGFSGHIFRRWMANSLLYSLSATAITLVDRHSRRLRARRRQIPGTQADPEPHARRIDHAVCRARAPDLPRVECAWD